MEMDSAALGAARVGRDGDVDRAVDRLQELPEDHGGGVAEDCSRPAGEHSCHEAAVEAKCVVSDGVDAAMDAVQAPVAGAFRRATLPQPNRFELMERHHPMLLRRDFIDSRVDRVELVSHKGTKSTGASGSPPTPAALASGPPRSARFCERGSAAVAEAGMGKADVSAGARERNV